MLSEVFIGVTLGKRPKESVGDLVVSLVIEDCLGLNSDAAATTVGVAAPAIGAADGGQISVLSETCVGVTRGTRPRGSGSNLVASLLIDGGSGSISGAAAAMVEVEGFIVGGCELLLVEMGEMGG